MFAELKGLKTSIDFSTSEMWKTEEKEIEHWFHIHNKVTTNDVPDMFSQQ